MSTIAAFAGVDWGTTSFRLWLMAEDGAMLAERRSNEGLSASAEAGFPAVLSRHLDAVGAPGDLPVVICGMAGSRQGWVEAGYIDIPARLDAIAEKTVEVAGMGRMVRILPGLAQRAERCADVMRGEETLLLGAGAGNAEGLFCLPGTHSKWVRLERGEVSGFSTFMTGELFDVVSKHSILSHAMTAAGAVSAGDPAFVAGVIEAFRQPERITSMLFSVRAAQLLFEQDGAAARARLSGLLIGLELAGSGCTREGAPPATLVASAGLASLYEAALRAIGVEVRSLDAEQAVRAGLTLAARSIFGPDKRRRPA